MPDLMLDLFDGDAFTAVTMTNYVNTHVPFTPGFLGKLGLFTAEGVYTQDVAFDDVSGQLKLISSSPRGSAPSQDVNMKGTTRKLSTTHLSREAVIKADEIANVRVLGSASQLRTAEQLVYSRVSGPTGLRAQMDYTMENLFLGATQGIVYDADGETVLWNYFNFYGQTQPAAVPVPFSTMTADDGVFDAFMRGQKRAMIKALNGFPLGGAQPIYLCGDNFFDAVVDNPEVIKARQIQAVGNANAPRIIAEAAGPYESFSYGGAIWVNYRSSDDGKVAVPTNEARGFMMGVPGLFMTYFSPADTFEFVNTQGLPVYMLQLPERQTSRARAFEVQSNPLPICLRPLHLQRLVKA